MGDKKLDFQDLWDGCQYYGLYIGQDEAREAFKVMDTSGDGSISFDEFLVALRVRSQLPHSLERVVPILVLQFENDPFSW